MNPFSPTHEETQMTKEYVKDNPKRFFTVLAVSPKEIEDTINYGSDKIYVVDKSHWVLEYRYKFLHSFCPETIVESGTKSVVMLFERV